MKNSSIALVAGTLGAVGVGLFLWKKAADVAAAKAMAAGQTPPGWTLQSGLNLPPGFTPAPVLGADEGPKLAGLAGLGLLGLAVLL